MKRFLFCLAVLAGCDECRDGRCPSDADGRVEVDRIELGRSRNTEPIVLPEKGSITIPVPLDRPLD